MFAGGRLDETGQASQQAATREHCSSSGCFSETGAEGSAHSHTAPSLSASPVYGEAGIAPPAQSRVTRRLERSPTIAHRAKASCLLGRVNPQPTTLPGKEQKTWGDYGLVRMMAQVPDGRSGVKHGHGSADTKDTPVRPDISPHVFVHFPDTPASATSQNAVDSTIDGE